MVVDARIEDLKDTCWRTCCYHSGKPSQNRLPIFDPTNTKTKTKIEQEERAINGNLFIRPLFKTVKSSLVHENITRFAIKYRCHQQGQSAQ